MKKDTIFGMMLLLGWALAGCGEDEIGLYDQTVRINFAKTYLEEVVFADSDYVKGATEKDVEIWLQLQGRLLETPRHFCLKTAENEAYSLKAELLFDESYVFGAAALLQKVNARVRRPDALTGMIPCQADICFDTQNERHEFEPGREDAEKAVLKVTYRIKTNSFNAWFWGPYSDAKYFFMMDLFRATADKVEETEENQLKVYEAYEEYKKTHDPLLDENGNEIVFINPAE